LAKEGHAPKFLEARNRLNVPWKALILACLPGALAYLSIKEGSNNVPTCFPALPRLEPFALSTSSLQYMIWDRSDAVGTLVSRSNDDERGLNPLGNYLRDLHPLQENNPTRTITRKYSGGSKFSSSALLGILWSNVVYFHTYLPPSCHIPQSRGDLSDPPPSIPKLID
jgi:hypothetical protein